METLLDPGRRLIQEGAMWKNGSSTAMHLLKEQAPQIRVKSSPRLQGRRSIPLRDLGSLRSSTIKRVFGSELRHNCLRCGHDPECNFIHPQQRSPFPERLELPFSSDAILSGYEDLSPQVRITSGSDHFILWGKMSPTRDLSRPRC